MTSPVVFDTSALLAVVLRERGSDIVQSVRERRLLSSVNVAEVYAKLIDLGFDMRAIDAVVRRLDVTVIAFDAIQARLSGNLREKTKDIGLSLGDRACIALGITKAAVVYTADQIWQRVDLGIEIKLIR